MTDLLVIVPTRSRPESVARVVDAWEATGAFDDGAALLFVVDDDDPQYAEYRRQIEGSQGLTSAVYEPAWRPLVPKLNRIATALAVDRYTPMLGFAGDDHLPRTPGWARRYVETLRELGTGIVYCDDGYQHENIPTQWAMTSDIVRTLGRMVPAPVDHLYCDNAVRDVGRGAACLRYLPDVLIEHMHPVAGKAGTDEQYERVNGSEQYKRDRVAYRRWSREAMRGDIAAIRELIESGERP